MLGCDIPDEGLRVVKRKPGSIPGKGQQRFCNRPDKGGKYFLSMDLTVIYRLLGGKSWLKISLVHPSSHLDKILDPCGELVGTWGEGGTTPPSKGRCTLDLTFQFDNPLTGQARGQTSLVASRYPQKYPPLHPLELQWMHTGSVIQFEVGITFSTGGKYLHRQIFLPDFTTSKSCRKLAPF